MMLGHCFLFEHFAKGMGLGARGETVREEVEAYLFALYLSNS